MGPDGHVILTCSPKTDPRAIRVDSWYTVHKGVEWYGKVLDKLIWGRIGRLTCCPLNHRSGWPYHRPEVCTKCAQRNEHHRILLVSSVFFKGDQPSNPSFSAKGLVKKEKSIFTSPLSISEISKNTVTTSKRRIIPLSP